MECKSDLTGPQHLSKAKTSLQPTFPDLMGVHHAGGVLVRFLLFERRRCINGRRLRVDHLALAGAGIFRRDATFPNQAEPFIIHNRVALAEAEPWRDHAATTGE